MDRPKVAAVAANEQVSKNMIATIEAAELEKMSLNGEIKDCIVEGLLPWIMLYLKSC